MARKQEALMELQSIEQYLAEMRQAKQLAIESLKERCYPGKPMSLKALRAEWDRQLPEVSLSKLIMKEQEGYVLPGETLVARVDEGRLVLEKREQILARLQDTFAKVPPDVSLVDELIAERREEARREAEL